MTYVLVVQFQIQFLKFCCTGVKGKLAWQYTATHFKQIHPVNLFQKGQIKKVKVFTEEGQRFWRLISTDLSWLPTCQVHQCPMFVLDIPASMA